jgi:hypothetical protein
MTWQSAMAALERPTRIPIESRPHQHPKNQAHAARFTPQQAEDSLATRKSTTSILRLSRKYPLIPF